MRWQGSGGRKSGRSRATRSRRSRIDRSQPRRSATAAAGISVQDSPPAAGGSRARGVDDRALPGTFVAWRSVRAQRRAHRVAHAEAAGDGLDAHAVRPVEPHGSRPSPARGSPFLLPGSHLVRVRVPSPLGTPMEGGSGSCAAVMGENGRMQPTADATSRPAYPKDRRHLPSARPPAHACRAGHLNGLRTT